MKYKKYTILCFLLITVFFYGQTNSSEREYYKWFDAIVSSENLGLFDGMEYKKKYRTAGENHKFYLSSKFTTGDVVYDGQSYFDVLMRYDIYDDELIVKLPDQLGFSSILLIREKVENFTLNNHFFVNLSNLKYSKNMAAGFHEILSKSASLTLLKKHSKSRKEYLNEKLIYSKFKGQKGEYLLSFNKEYHTINSKKDLLRLFPEQKKEINTYYNSNRLLRNSNHDLFMNKLIRQTSNLITN